MSFWVLIQILVNLILFAGVAAVWVRLHRPAKDDPRLSKGLQLLQSKIAVLEDLSDRTEHQVSQLTALLETKCRDIQEKIVAADRQISRIDQSAQKSMEVAKIFQDRIPHSEILERQNTIKYVKAARMAHRGASIEEIVNEVDLSRAEIEFIAKVNRDRLQFSEEDLPEWARGELETAATSMAPADLKFSLPRQSFESQLPPQQPVPVAMPAPVAPIVVQPSQMPTTNQGFREIDLSGGTTAAKKAAATTKAQTTGGKSVEIRPVSFPRIDGNKNL